MKTIQATALAPVVKHSSVIHVSQVYQEKISLEAKGTNIQYSESAAAAAARAPLPFSARCLLLN